jgi:hypothetical protein
MLTITEIGGFAGAGLAGAAYVPQISHLIRARCSAGISRLAFGVWLVASVLITARAIAIHDGVFIALGGIEIVATTFIVVYAARYRDTPCPVHLPRQPTAKTGATGNEPGGRSRTLRRSTRTHAAGPDGRAGRTGTGMGMAMCDHIVEKLTDGTPVISGARLHARAARVTRGPSERHPARLPEDAET